MTQTTAHCPICNYEDSVMIAEQDRITVKCPGCKEFSYDTDVDHDYFLQHGPIIRGRNAWQAEERRKPVHITKANQEELIADPPGPLERLDLALQAAARRTPAMGHSSRFNSRNDLGLAYCTTATEFQLLFDMLHDENLVNNGGFRGNEETGLEGKVRVKFAGWRHLQELERHTPRPREVFVAMSFHESMQSAFNLGIAPGIRDAGLTPRRVDDRPHSDSIDQRILTMIRSSGMLVADFTQQRQGVYFEAGYALALGKPVIWCCRRDDRENLHFDTRQYNYILWDRPEDLRQQIAERIEYLSSAAPVPGNPDV